MSRAQLLELGMSAEAIDHRLERGRLYRVHQGVYAVGREELTRQGRWMAAVLACGPGAVLSHESAAALWGIRRVEGSIEVSVPARRSPRRQGLIVHRRLDVGPVTRRHGIPVTTPACTIVDLASRLEQDELEAAVNEADVLRLVDPEALRRAAKSLGGRRGAARVRKLLDRRTFRLSRSRLERLFIPIALAAGLPRPLTRQWVNGYEVDFYWPDLGLVVETDGLQYHRTPAQQARDRERDQAHTASGLVPLRFTHGQVAFEAEHVRATLEAVATRLPTAGAGRPWSAPGSGARPASAPSPARSA